MPKRAILAAVLSVLFGIPAAGEAAPFVIDPAGRSVRVAADSGAAKPKLVLHTTMATWCAACRTELPQLAFVRSAFKPEELAMYGLPYDEKERPDQLRGWAATHRPPYQLLTEVTPADVVSVKGMVLANMRMDGVPATFITDPQGRILRARFGPPSVSEIRELLRAQSQRK